VYLFDAVTKARLRAVGAGAGSGAGDGQLNAPSGLRLSADGLHVAVADCNNCFYSSKSTGHKNRHI